ncbi:MAG: orotate phosphoribosyltransferase [Gemmatimonadales bacterium]
MSDPALAAILGRRSIRRGDFVLASGARSSYYIDCRLTTMSAEGQEVIGRLGRAALAAAGWQPSAVGGLTMGADPVACAIARASVDAPPAINAFSVRKQAKDHGTGRLIEGNLSAGDPVVVVEDVITSGGSALQAVRSVEAAGAKVLGVLAVVDREEGGRAAIEAAGYPVHALITASLLGLTPA